MCVSTHVVYFHRQVAVVEELTFFLLCFFKPVPVKVVLYCFWP